MQSVGTVKNAKHFFELSRAERGTARLSRWDTQTGVPFVLERRDGKKCEARTLDSDYYFHAIWGAPGNPYRRRFLSL